MSASINRASSPGANRRSRPRGNRGYRTAGSPRGRGMPQSRLARFRTRRSTPSSWTTDCAAWILSLMSLYSASTAGVSATTAKCPRWLVRVATRLSSGRCPLRVGTTSCALRVRSSPRVVCSARDGSMKVPRSISVSTCRAQAKRVGFASEGFRDRTGTTASNLCLPLTTPLSDRCHLPPSSV